MLENIPTQSTMAELLGQSLFKIWQSTVYKGLHKVTV